MFHLLQKKHVDTLQLLIKQIDTIGIDETVRSMQELYTEVHAAIPEKKRISVGGYSIIKKMGEEMFPMLLGEEVDVLTFGMAVYQNKNYDRFMRSLAVQLISLSGEETGDLKHVLPFFEKVALDDDWIVRECSCGFVRKLFKKYPDEVKRWYLKMVRSSDPLQRRFACESLRPVADNAWFRKKWDFVSPILEHLYHEPVPYPRTSIGNTLSDWMRIDETRTVQLVETLASDGDKNSYWIAYRACRNLVKKQPEMVMNILQVDTYKYKDRQYKT